MATSGSYDLSSGYGTIRVEWWYISQNIGANTTRIGWRAVATWAGNTWLQVYACRIWINGAQVLNRGSAQTWGGQFASGELDIGMDADGNKTFGSNGEAAIYTSGLNAWGSGSWALPTVPRYATTTYVPDINDEQDLTFNYSNPAGNAVSTLRAAIFDNTTRSMIVGWRDISKTASAYTFSFTTAERNALRANMANSTSRVMFVSTETSIGGNTAWSERTFTLSIINGAPVFSDFSYKDSNAATVAITGNDQYIVQGYSTLQATILAANKMQALKSATPVQYKYQIGSIDTTQAYTTSDLVKELGTVGLNSNSNLNIIAVDSRNLTTTVAKAVSILPYQAPQLNPIAERVNNFETSTKIKVTGVISRLTIGGTDKNGVNAASGLQYRYKKTDTGTWGAWQNIASTTSGGNVSITDFYVNLDRNFAWNVEFRLTDKITATTVALVVTVGIPIFRIGKDGLTYNKEQPLMPSHIGQVIHSTVLSTAAAVSAIYGGTWVAFGVGRVAVGVDTSQTEFNTVKKTGGHKLMQAHKHTIAGGAGNNYMYDLGISDNRWGLQWATTTGYHAVGGAMDNYGGGDSQNLQPYITLYMWERTA